MSLSMSSTTEIAAGENSESDNFDGIKRKRSSVASVASLNVLLKDSDDENSPSEAEDSEEYSDDEWNTGNKKKKRNSKKSNRSPVQTLKKKLAEKTKTLRKSIKQNRSPEIDKPLKVEKEKEVALLVPVKNEKTDIKEEKTEACKELKEINEKLPSIKIEKKNKMDKNTPMIKKPEPVVLTYATVKNSACMSPFLISSSLASVTSQSVVSTASTFQLSTSTVSSSDLISSSPAQNVNNDLVHTIPSSLVQTQLSFPGTSSISPQNTFPAALSNQQKFISSPSSNHQSASRQSPGTKVARLRINPNLQTSPGVGQNLFNTSSTNCNINATPSPSSRVRYVPVQKTPTQSSPSPRSRSAVSNSARTSSYRPRRLALNGSPNTNTRSFNSGVSPRSVTTPRTVSLSRRNVPAACKINSSNSTLHNSITSIRNISSRGTVIVNGSNSVTITPRKIVPERPPVQRTLFKNEIEGIIAARVENGVLRYVVNLANGTHLSLSNLQVTKLREQNNGVLPTKLKIPVPSDVAAKIEPSYLIED